MAARAVPAFYLHFIYCVIQFAVVANDLNMRIAIIPEENEKSEPFSNRKQVRIFLVWWARVSRRAALLKKPHRGFFARRDASAVPQLFESTRRGVTLVFCKRKRPACFLRWSFWWARVDSNKPHSLLWLLACAQSNGFMPLFGLPPERPLHPHAQRCA